MPLAQQHDAVRDSWDSLTLFARGHAGRLAPYVAPKHSALAREQSLANKHSAKRYSNGPAGDAELGPHFPCVTSTYVPICVLYWYRYKVTNTDAEAVVDLGLSTRLGSAPVEGRGVHI